MICRVLRVCSFCEDGNVVSLPVSGLTALPPQGTASCRTFRWPVFSWQQQFRSSVWTIKKPLPYAHIDHVHRHRRGAPHQGRRYARRRRRGHRSQERRLAPRCRAHRRGVRNKRAGTGGEPFRCAQGFWRHLLRKRRRLERRQHRAHSRSHLADTAGRGQPSSRTLGNPLHDLRDHSGDGPV